MENKLIINKFEGSSSLALHKYAKFDVNHVKEATFLRYIKRTTKLNSNIDGKNNMLMDKKISES